MFLSWRVAKPSLSLIAGQLFGEIIQVNEHFVENWHDGVLLFVRAADENFTMQGLEARLRQAEVSWGTLGQMLSS